MNKGKGKRVKQNIVLIGMPGAGKSTTGVLLAKHLSKMFLDTDLLIQNRIGMSLQKLLDEDGYLELRKIEENEILQINVNNTVIATGGSVVYSEKAMEHLKNHGLVVYLENEAGELLERIDNLETRGIAKKKEQSFFDLFLERERLYKKYCDIVIDCRRKSHSKIIVDIVKNNLD